MTQFQAGQRVKVARGHSAYVGQHGVVLRSSFDTVRVTLDSGDEYGFYAANLDLCPGPQEVPSAPPAVKQNQRAQPDLAAFFKGPSNYAQCPNCRTGKLVPMFSGQALCDQACERNPRAGCRGIGQTYWASWCDTDTNRKGSHSVIWDSKDSAEWWTRGIPALRVTLVEWLGSALPDFVDYDSTHSYYEPTADEVREVTP